MQVKLIHLGTNFYFLYKKKTGLSLNICSCKLNQVQASKISAIDEC